MWARYDTLGQARGDGWLTLADAFREARERGVRVSYRAWPVDTAGLRIVSADGQHLPIDIELVELTQECDVEGNIGVEIAAVRREVVEAALQAARP